MWSSTHSQEGAECRLWCGEPEHCTLGQQTCRKQSLLSQCAMFRFSTSQTTFSSFLTRSGCASHSFLCPLTTIFHLADESSKVKGGNLWRHTTEVCLTDRIQNLKVYLCWSAGFRQTRRFFTILVSQVYLEWASTATIFEVWIRFSDGGTLHSFMTIVEIVEYELPRGIPRK